MANVSSDDGDGSKHELVTWPPPRRRENQPRDRGQLILLTGMVMAVSLVAIVVLVNTAIFTENLATRGVDIGGQEAVSYQKAASESIEGLIEEENKREYAARANLEDNVTNGVDKTDELLRQQRIVNSAATNVSNVTLHEGALLRQTNASREMIPDDGLPLLSLTPLTWTLATDVSDTREFVLDVNNGLASTTTPSADSFKVTIVGNGGNEWHLYVYENSSTSNTELAVKNGTEVTPTKGICSPSTNPQINLTNGTVDGTPCSAIQFGKGTSQPYDIEYYYGNRSTGTYNLTVNTSGSASIETSNFHGPGPADSPYWFPVVYSAEIDVYYENAAIQYRGRIRIVPGENE